jgi:hypothetical protein
MVSTWIKTRTFPGLDDVAAQVESDRDEQIELVREVSA